MSRRAGGASASGRASAGYAGDATSLNPHANTHAAAGLYSDSNPFSIIDIDCVRDTDPPDDEHSYQNIYARSDSAAHAYCHAGDPASDVHRAAARSGLSRQRHCH